ncbi:MAG: aminoacyl-tRNA hydrolase [Pseudomonadota bacterium]
MKLLVGLGNPGAKYDGTRHNIGFMAVDRIAQEHGLGPFRAKFQGDLAEGRIGASRVMLLKPTTYMNKSGQSVGEALRFYKLSPQDVIVFHDELDLAPGKVRVKSGGGHAGHNGLRSLHDHMGDGYGRVRLGIGHPGDKALVSNYVLGGFAKADQTWLEDVLHGVADGVADLVEGDMGRFLNAVARRAAPARPSTGQKKPDGAKAQSTAPAPGPAIAPAPKPKLEAEAEPQAPRSALQRLVDKFR